MTSVTLTAPATRANQAFKQPAAVSARFYNSLATPIGELLITSDGDTLTGLYMMPDAHFAPDVTTGWRRSPAHLHNAAQQLSSYFAGELRTFDLPLAPSGTAFQLEVWAALLEIPFGETASYGEIAAAIDRPAASRAVGAANGRNPIAVIVPCHRVIGASGALVGYGGGLDRKRTLREHERGVSAL